MARKRAENLKKSKVIQRFHNRKSCAASVNKKEQDVSLIDLVLTKLYNNGDKIPASIDKDILQPNHIKFTDAGSNRLWDIILNTGLVKPEVGFGKVGSLTLTHEGYQLMANFGSYKNFISKREEQAKSNTPQVFPQFILTTGVPESEENEEQNEESIDKNKKAASK